MPDSTGGPGAEPFPGPAQSQRPSVLATGCVGWSSIPKQDMHFLWNSARAARHHACFLVEQEGWMQ